jgi:DNA-binding FadR family transcriptional regulator
VRKKGGWTLQPLEPQLRYREVRDRIREYILSHKLRGGDRLPSESELAHLLRVSRNAVREGLRALEGEGIIEVRRGSGSYVRELVLDDLLASFAYSLFFDRDSVEELYLIRQKLEENFLPIALAKLSPKTVGELRQLIRRMSACGSWGREYLEYDLQLHRTIFSAVGNKTLLKLFDIFSAIYRRAYHILERRSPSEHRRDLAAHAALVDRLERRDLPGALRALRRTWARFPALALEARVRSVGARRRGGRLVGRKHGSAALR